MARRQAAQRAALNTQTEEDNRNVPPSTITAQIVEQHNHNRPQNGQDTGDAFAQLLDEVRANPMSIEADVQGNYQLIRVVAEAGLDSLLKSDPFESSEARVARAVACVDVIEIAVQRTPEAVFFAGESVNSSESQLCLWLLPKVISVLELYELHTLQQSLHRLLTTLLKALSSRIQLSQRYSILQRLYQVYAEDLLGALEQSDPSAPQITIDRPLPTAEALEVVCGQLQLGVALQQGSHITIRTGTHAIHAVLALVAAISSAAVDETAFTLSSISTRAAQNWTLRILSRLYVNVWSVMAASNSSMLPIDTIEALLSTQYDVSHSVISGQRCNIIRQKAGRLLISCISMIISKRSSSLSIAGQTQAAKTLTLAIHFCEQCKSVLQEARQQLLPAVLLIVDDKELLQELSLELSVALETFVDLTAPLFIEFPNGTMNSETANGTMGLIQQVNGDRASADRHERPTKRQKVEPDHDQSASHNLLSHLCLLLGDWDLGNLSGLGASTAGLFSDLSEPDKCSTLQTLAKIPCSGSSSADIIPEAFTTNSRWRHCECPVNQGHGKHSREWGLNYWKWFQEILTGLIESADLQSSKQHRILMMQAVATFIRHTPVSEHRDLSGSSLGNWCLQSLRSSSRELRLAAGYALPVFLLTDLPYVDVNLCRRNRIAALEFLRQLDDSKDAKYCETLILTLGQIACVCGDEELNIVLLRLVEYLGHVNPIISAVAHLELRHIAQFFSLSAEDLIKPFWRSIAITVVKDLLTRPQKAQQLSDLLGIGVNQFLTLTQAETLPYLVLWKKQDILLRLVKSRGTSKATVWNLCMLPQNLPSILAILIIQNPSDLEKTVLGYLSHASMDFQHEDVSSLLKVDPISTACEVLKLAGDEEGLSRERAVEGFQGLMFAVERRGHQSKAASTQARMAEIFFENHALGIMASFSDIIDNPNQTRVEKKRCLRAIQQMIHVARGNIRVALPQIRSCLQSALEDPSLRDEAFIAWIALLSALELDEDLEVLIDQTFSVLVQNWDNFGPSVQQQAYDAVTTLLKSHSVLIQNTATSIPSLASIPLMSKIESQLARLRGGLDTHLRIRAFTRRCQDEASAVVLQALRELVPYLYSQQQWIHDAGTTEQPGSALAEMVRTLLDTCVRFKEDSDDILDLCTTCLGILGCLDPNRIDAVREKREITLLSNFEQAQEAVDFVAFLLENVLVKAFHSVSNPRAQGFLAYAMQELLKFCGFSKEATANYRPMGNHADETYQCWMQMPESVRGTLQPFLSSRYVLTTHSSKNTDAQTYPIFSADIGHGTWLRNFVFDLLQRANGDNAKKIFGVLSRIIRGYDVSIAAFLLPFAAANVIMGGTDQEVSNVGLELRTVLEYSANDRNRTAVDHLKSCSENIFQVLDYLTKWLQEKKKRMAAARTLAARSGKQVSEFEETTGTAHIRSVEAVLSGIPADIISRRAVECGSYARALFHWEQYIRQEKDGSSRKSSSYDDEFLYNRLQEIYSQIDEPDGLDGISAFIQVLSPEQQVLEHKRAGRWGAAQSWYELELSREPENIDFHVSLLGCLQQAGQHHMVLDHARSLSKSYTQDRRVLSIISKASWCTERWHDLEEHITSQVQSISSDFNIGLGKAMLALRNQNRDAFATIVQTMRLTLARTFSESATASMQTCHDQLLKLHALHEVETISGLSDLSIPTKADLQTALNQRLEIVGSYLSDKQYLLGIRRAVMRLSNLEFNDRDIASSWMSTAKLARKENWLNIAYNAVLHASELGDESAKIERARLLWKDGEHRKAIQSLEGAIATNAFETAADGLNSAHASLSTAANTATRSGKQQEQNLLIAKANLLLAKWLDMAGQTQSNVVNRKYQHACKSYSKWEKGFYHLGRFYNKLLESEKALPTSKQTHSYLGGETAKLVVENYLRSLMFGCKYIAQTMPKLLTLWLDFGIEAGRSVSHEVPDDVRVRTAQIRPKMLDTMNKQVKKYAEKVPAYLFYTALPQMITRMGHPNKEVYDILALIIIRVVTAHPQQGLWPLLAVVKSSAFDRSSRGGDILSKLKEKGKNIRNEGQSVDLKSLVIQGQKLSDQLLHACEVNIDGRASTISLKKDLGVNPNTACPLVVPLERTLSVNLPTASDYAQLRQHKPFPMSREAITISSFMDEVQVLSSLQKPRKLTVRASNGQKYGLLCKPNDDLRKDQRLMEFNAMINRSLKKDAESSKRRLYVKTYAVTPLNEACGLIEWVDGLKPMRDILMNSYRAKNIKVDYNLLRDMLTEACATPENSRIFTEQILPMYPPVLHEWFTDHFPDPESWFAARLRYTRSCAVSSMVGYALGLGDRHGENVLLEENSGGVFHVDFNCLFEKGLTFDKPELVPFRLTHNMVDAFGAYGVEGPFRRSAECAMKVMRANEDALLTILETFVYDPTADFVGQRKRTVKGVPETPREVLDSVRSKVRGLMRGESVPLSVGGHVDALVKAATDPKNLCAMYIGWCAFF